MSKKTVQQIIHSGNDYVIAVKANQPKLYHQIQQNMQHSQPTTIHTDFERRSGRFTQRRVCVFENLNNISHDWLGLKSIIQVERVGTRAGKAYQETAYYISSLSLKASDFACGIRRHWGVENRLHWVKDVVFDEDSAQMVDGYAAANFSILRSFVINLFRHNGFDSLTRAIRFCSHNIPLLFSFLE
ncbi:transposase [Nostoc piscinale CENA21]|uniref:Transposase n=3 Tax=Nostoc TaxID=1177 RepID=A0A0M4TIE7_9NOSO|nr:ISAs1 family transposase [Nostoc piscinale]ALF51994.1 transposase [Nostoc piscinale CENA21]ALF52311.1 transposase [Nostoc piscinale CENA21]